MATATISFDNMSVITSMYRLPRRDVGNGPSTSIDMNSSAHSGGNTDRGVVRFGVLLNWRAAHIGQRRTIAAQSLPREGQYHFRANVWYIRVDPGCSAVGAK
jgi:hypothetical protein